MPASPPQGTGISSMESRVHQSPSRGQAAPSEHPCGASWIDSSRELTLATEHIGAAAVREDFGDKEWRILGYLVALSKRGWGAWGPARGTCRPAVGTQVGWGTRADC